MRTFLPLLGILIAFSALSGTVTITTDQMPQNSVLASTGTCPSGWSTHVASQGRFIRGIDPTDLSQNIGDLSAGSNPTYSATLDLFSSDISNRSNDPFAASPLGSKLTDTSGLGQGMGTIFLTGEVPSVTVSTSGTSLPPSVIYTFCEKN